MQACKAAAHQRIFLPYLRISGKVKDRRLACELQYDRAFSQVLVSSLVTSTDFVIVVVCASVRGPS